MKENIQIYLDWVSKAAVLIVILTTLFLFSNLTSDFYDTPKFLTLLAVTGILLISLAVKFTLSNKVVLIRTPLDLPLLLLLAVGVISTVLSSSPYVALLGNQLKIHGSLISLVIYILFYFVLVNNLKSGKGLRWLIFISTIAGVVLSVITLLAYAGVTLLPAPWVHGINFTPTGSSFSTTAFLVLLLPSVVSQIISSTKPPTLILNSIFLILFGLTITLTGSLVVWIAAILGILLTLITHGFFARFKNFTKLNQIKPVSLISLFAPLIVVAIISFLSFIPGQGGAENPLYTQVKNFPREIQLSPIVSWKTAVSTFRDSPFWGSGPSTFLFDFTNYKPIEMNSTKFWNLRFDNAFNEYFQVLATLGGIGLVALLSITALFISSAFPVILKAVKESKNDSEAFHHAPNDKLILAISGLVFFILLLLHPSSLVLWVFGLFILASFMVSAQQSTENQESNHHIGASNIKDTLMAIAGNIKQSGASSQTIRVETLPSILLVITLGAALFTFFFAGKFALADYHHRNALNAVSQNLGIVAYNELVVAEKLNPYNDLYRIDLAQTNFALANAIALAKRPTEASPSGSLTEQDQQNIQVLLQQSINEGRTATNLSPRSAGNWEILALLYRQIAGVAQNALVFSLDSYGRAIFQDPLNPNLRLAVGGVYYAVQSYDLAIRFFTDAINLKPDFANGYFNLSVALKDKGDLAGAQAAAEKVLTLVEADSQDYKIASEYLAELKKKAEKTAAIPPASETTGALQEENLPKVVNVGKPPEKIATPAAVKKSAATPTSTPQPTFQP